MMEHRSKSLGVTWFKSSRSLDNGCVEVRFRDGVLEMRDSKDVSGPTLAFVPNAWADFLRGVVRGEFDGPV